MASDGSWRDNIGIGSGAGAASGMAAKIIRMAATAAAAATLIANSRCCVVALTAKRYLGFNARRPLTPAANLLYTYATLYIPLPLHPHIPYLYFTLGTHTFTPSLGPTFYLHFPFLSCLTFSPCLLSAFTYALYFLICLVSPLYACPPYPQPARIGRFEECKHRLNAGGQKKAYLYWAPLTAVQCYR